MSGISKTILFVFAVGTFVLFIGLNGVGNKIAKINTESFINDQMKSCYKKPESGACYREVAVNLLDHYSLPTIMDVFEKNESKPEYFEKCHEVSHYLGQEEYKRVGNLQKVFSESRRTCLGGTYHGAVEGYFMYKKLNYSDEVTVKNEIKKICGKSEDYTRPQDFIECNHGLGHATMYITDNDLPKALDYCDALGSSAERELCYTGALMSNGDSFKSDDHPTKYIKEDDPLYPCSILKKQQQRQCYTYGTLSRFQDNLQKSIDICNAVPDEFKSSCFETIGRDRTMLSDNPNTLKSQCSEITDQTYKKSCISGTSYNLVIRFGIESEIPRNYCEITDEVYKSSCYSNITRAARNITRDPEKIKNFCNLISEDDFRNKCLSSI